YAVDTTDEVGDGAAKRNRVDARFVKTRLSHVGPPGQHAAGTRVDRRDTRTGRSTDAGETACDDQQAAAKDEPAHLRPRRGRVPHRQATAPGPLDALVAPDVRKAEADDAAHGRELPAHEPATAAVADDRVRAT